MSSRNARVVLLATLLICAEAHAQDALAPASASESPAAVEARTAVARARALFAVGDYGAALAEFTRAHELLHDDPRQPDILNNMAVCYERMFRYDLALTHYERYLRESTAASAADRAEVEAAMTALRDLLGTVRVTGVAGADVWIDDRELGQVPLDVLVPAGLHVIEVRKSRYETLRRELRVSARTMHTVDAPLEKVETYQGLPSTYFWIGTGLTAAAFVTGGVLGIAALVEHDDKQRDADRGLWVDGEPARDLALQADIAFGAAIAFGVGTTVLYFMTDWSSPSEAKRSAQAPALSLDLANRAAYVSWRGELP